MQRLGRVGFLVSTASSFKPAHTDSGTSADDQYALAQRFRAGLSSSNLRLRKSYTVEGAEMKTFAVRTRDGLVFAKGGLPVARVAQLEVEGTSVEELAALVEDPVSRAEWDTANCAESRVVKDQGRTELHYLRGRAGWIVPARDFVYSQVRLSPAALGINNFQSIVILRQDASASYPSRWDSIRARANSVFVLEPLSPTRVLLTYMVELAPGGRAAWLDNATVDFFAGDSMLKFLLNLKCRSEKSSKESEGLSVEEAARRRFHQKQKKAASSSILDDLNTSGVSKSDLQQTVRMLEKRLADLSRQEKAEGLDLSSLRGKIQDDLTSARERLRRA